MGNMGRPGVPAPYSDDEMYTAWVACNRNAAAAARKLGDISGVALQAHARRKHFESRYAAEYSGTAEGVRRMALTDMVLNLPKILDVLLGVITDTSLDEEGKANTPQIAKVRAIEVYLKYLPAAKEAQDQPMSYIDAQAVLVMPGDEQPSVEEQVRNQLEANIIDANEQRTRRKA